MPRSIGMLTSIRTGFGLEIGLDPRVYVRGLCGILTALTKEGYVTCLNESLNPLPLCQDVTHGRELTGVSTMKLQ